MRRFDFLTQPPLGGVSVDMKYLVRQPIGAPEINFTFMSHKSVGIVKKKFEIRPDLGCSTFKTSRKLILDNPSVCLSVCLSVLL